MTAHPDPAIDVTPPADTDLPFDTDRLDELLERAGIDVLLVSSKHNIHYLLGGYRFFFFDHFDAIGISRYLPVLIYPRGARERAAYVGQAMEAYEKELGRFWMDYIKAPGTSIDAMQCAVEYVRKLGGESMRIGVERAFLPADAEEVLRTAFPHAAIVDAVVPLERLRAIKTPYELDCLREASERVVASMSAVIAGHGAGASKHEIVEALRGEERRCGLTFEYCLIAAGTSCNRAPSDQVWRDGDILSLDSGGNYKGYIGDLCRMAILGEPDAELEDLLAIVDDIQLAARRPIRAGAPGGDLVRAAQDTLRRRANGNSIEFVAHGMGLVSHEAPRLMRSRSFPYPPDDFDRPLAAGMVISIETTLAHPRRGFIKLEDTVAVTEDGWEAFGDSGRGWNRGGVAS